MRLEASRMRFYGTCGFELSLLRAEADRMRSHETGG
jgi:hypothetical protein